MRGMLYGVGVGPGDPELLTLKAARVIKAADVIAVPGKEPEQSVAWKIAVQAVPELADKECLAIDLPMTKDESRLKESHDLAARRIAAVLEAGKDAAFLTLGDPCVYSTYLYVDQKIREMGYPAQIVSGVTSFCAAAAALGVGLAEQAQPLHILPASYPIENGLRLPGTKILMKAGKKIKAVKEQLEKNGAEVWLAENCGMAQERLIYGAQNIPEDAGYYTLLIVKEP